LGSIQNEFFRNASREIKKIDLISGAAATSTSASSSRPGARADLLHQVTLAVFDLDDDVRIGADCQLRVSSTGVTEVFKVARSIRCRGELAMFTVLVVVPLVNHSLMFAETTSSNTETKVGEAVTLRVSSIGALRYACLLAVDHACMRHGAMPDSPWAVSRLVGDSRERLNFFMNEGKRCDRCRPPNTNDATAPPAHSCTVETLVVDGERQ
jgi:hypothetical protein